MSTPQEQFVEFIKVSSPRAVELAKTIDLNSDVKNGLTPLMYACSLSEVTVVETLLSRQEIKVDAADKRQCTALFYVDNNIKRGLPIVLLLLNAGASINHKNLKGETAVDLSKREMKDVFVMLQSIQALYAGRTLLEQLCINLHKDLIFDKILPCLLSLKSIDVNYTPPNAEPFRVLTLVAGLGLNCKAVFEETGMSPIVYKARTGAVAKQLIERGAEVDFQSEKGQPAIYLAAHANNLPVLKVLVEAGAKYVIGEMPTMESVKRQAATTPQKSFFSPKKTAPTPIQDAPQKDYGLLGRCIAYKCDQEMKDYIESLQPFNSKSSQRVPEQGSPKYSGSP